MTEKDRCYYVDAYTMAQYNQKIKTKFNTIIDDITGISEDISTLTTSKVAKEDLDAQTDRIATLEKNVATKAELGTQKNRIDAINTNKADKTSITDLQTQITALKKAVTALGGTIE